MSTVPRPHPYEIALGYIRQGVWDIAAVYLKEQPFADQISGDNAEILRDVAIGSLIDLNQIHTNWVDQCQLPFQLTTDPRDRQRLTKRLFQAGWSTLVLEVASGETLDTIYEWVR
jgi:hypothetical protein